MPGQQRLGGGDILRVEVDGEDAPYPEPRGGDGMQAGAAADVEKRAALEARLRQELEKSLARAFDLLLANELGIRRPVVAERKAALGHTRLRTFLQPGGQLG